MFATEHLTISRDQLVKEYVTAIRNSAAALFVGAGLSRATGYVDWKGLLRGCAEELGLDLDREYDLVAVAQYYLNLSGQNRYGLNRMLLDEFGQPGVFTENHELIGRLPISTIWTTNFDTLIETALIRAGRRVDVKSTDADLALSKRHRDVVLYKMHGDIAHPTEIVICKADYERYARDHPVFQTTLEADLVAKTFLFLGFSFADPNLNYMLGQLRVLLDAHQHQHFAVMRRVRRNLALGDAGVEAFEYEQNKQRLQIAELQRYNIRIHLVDRFAEVADILRAIEEAALRRNVFVSGSASRFDDGLDELRVRDLCMELGESLIARGYRLISGVGLNIGDSVVKGAVLQLYNQRENGFEDRVLLRPFPRSMPPDVDEAEFMSEYRRDMIGQSGFVIFISGTSRSSRISAGVMQEYRIARELNRIPIAIGVSGFAAREIWSELREEREEVYRGRVDAELYDRLGDESLGNDELVETVFQIMDRIATA